MSRREVSRPPVRAVYRTTMAPESGADLVPLAPAPVPGKPGVTVSVKAAINSNGDLNTRCKRPLDDCLSDWAPTKVAHRPRGLPVFGRSIRKYFRMSSPSLEVNGRRQTLQ